MPCSSVLARFLQYSVFRGLQVDKNVIPTVVTNGLTKGYRGSKCIWCDPLDGFILRYVSVISFQIQALNLSIHLKEEQVTLHVAGIPSCLLATHSNMSLICYVSLLTGETGEPYSFDSSNKQLIQFLVLVVLTLWCGLRNCMFYFLKMDRQPVMILIFNRSLV